jgi:microcin C transport system substrate-binding protein
MESANMSALMPDAAVRTVCALLVCLWILPVPGAFARTENVIETHALTIAGDPAMPQGFSHFHYVNPDAPKGGTLRLYATGTFDSTNPFTPKGKLPAGFSLLYDSLTTAAHDEPDTQYCLVAERIRYPEDRSWIEFDINPAARFQDGSHITAEDVVFSYNATMNNMGNILQRFFSDITMAQAVNRLTVRYEFAPGASREIPLYIGTLPIYPKAFWQHRDLSRTALEKVVGSGPYRMDSYRQGREVIYKRVDGYWAENLPVCKGRYNFDTIRYEYYRDATVALEAFRAGHYDIREEHSAKNSHTLYKGPAFDRGEIICERLPHDNALGIQGFFFNTRRPMFSDVRVRRAIMLAMDFEWINRQFFWNEYIRTTSYFTNTDLACTGLPRGRELDLLEPFRHRLPREVFDTPHVFPVSDADGFNRTNLLKAAALLDDAGYRIQNGIRVNTATGRPLRFQLLTDSASVRRLALPFAANLRRLGIELNIFTADTPTFVRKSTTFDFDMISTAFGHGTYPGRELIFYWHSSTKNMEGSRNVAGVDDPVVDALIQTIIGAKDREYLQAACRALDRVLLWGEYVVPLGASNVHRVAYRKGLKRPDAGRYSFADINAWWDEKQEAAQGAAQ